MSVVRKIFITLLAIVSLFLLLFAGFPNRTGYSIGFEINLENILLYCVLPFVIGILIIGILVFLSIKTKKRYDFSFYNFRSMFFNNAYLCNLFKYHN